MLVVYLKEKIPGIKGYEKRSIERMVRFYNEYSTVEFASAIPTQIKEQAIASDVLTQFGDDAAVLFLLVQVGWSAHLEIMSGCTSPEERIFYILLSNRETLLIRNFAGRLMLVFMNGVIREYASITSIGKAYPDAGRIFKDTYMVDFLGLPENHSERSLQAGLVKQMNEFILELGKDFCLWMRSIVCRSE